MGKLYIFLIMTTFMFSCVAQKKQTKLYNGFYVGILNSNLITKYTVLISIKDSTATLDAYHDEKGMITAYDIFNEKQILPNTEYFKLYKDDKGYTLSSCLNQITMVAENGSFVMHEPLRVELKYYEKIPNSLCCIKKYSLFCYCWFYPNVILGVEKEFNTFTNVYIQNKMELDLKNINESLNYEEYYKMLKDSVTQYKFCIDNILK